jgi:competence protein ComFB
MENNMSFKDEYDFDLLVNEGEELVVEELEKELEKPEYDKICKCQDCILDMATLALNNLKPTYRSSLTGRIYAAQYHEGSYLKEAEVSVKNAIKKVSKNPSHD